jgi:hypothetical protein
VRRKEREKRKERNDEKRRSEERRRGETRETWNFSKKSKVFCHIVVLSFF